VDIFSQIQSLINVMSCWQKHCGDIILTVLGD